MAVLQLDFDSDAAEEWRLRPKEHPVDPGFEVGSELGVTRERVRQLESRALRELQAAAPDLRLYLRTE